MLSEPNCPVFLQYQCISSCFCQYLCSPEPGRTCADDNRIIFFHVVIPMPVFNYNYYISNIAASPRAATNMSIKNITNIISLSFMLSHFIFKSILLFIKAIFGLNLQDF